MRRNTPSIRQRNWEGQQMIKKTKILLKNPLVHEVEPDDYASVLEAISNKVRAAQTRAVNLELIQVYREISRIIDEKQ